MTLLLTALFLIIFEAVPEALRDNGKKTIAGIIESIYLLVVTSLILIPIAGYSSPIEANPSIVTILIGYILLRFALFDLTYNITRALPIFYVGTTKLSDKLLRRFLEWTKFPDDHFLFWTKGLSLLIALSLLMGW